MDRLNLTTRRLRFKKRVLSALVLAPFTLTAKPALADRIEEASLFGEIAGGTTHVVPKKGETSKNGYHLILTAFAEIASTDWVYQAGGGIFYNRLYSSGEKEYPGSQANTIRKQKNLRIETRSGEAELALRYKLVGPWEGGLIGRALFGNSLSFSQDKDAATKFFIGPHLVYRFSKDAEYLKRADMSLTTDSNVPHRRVYLLSGGLAIGKSYRRPPEELIPPPAPLPMPGAEDRYEEVLADKVINFPSGSSEVQGAALPFLKELGVFLKAHPELYQEIDVEGHTDANGKLAYNMKLSKDRAAAVRKVLTVEGVDEGKVKAEGFGPTRPLVKEDSAEARARNRRVVMGFNVTGKDQRHSLSTKIKELRKKYFDE